MPPPSDGVLPDDGVPFAVCNVRVVGEKDGVVRHHHFARGQNAAAHVAHAVQDAVVDQEVIHEQLPTHTHACTEHLLL